VRYIPAKEKVTGTIFQTRSLFGIVFLPWCGSAQTPPGPTVGDSVPAATPIQL
jgi:hypothetical protein